MIIEEAKEKKVVLNGLPASIFTMNLFKKHNTLKEFLKGYEEYAGVTLNWQCFGTSGVPFIPPGDLMIEHFGFKSQSVVLLELLCKAIVDQEKSKFVKYIFNTHAFLYNHPYNTVRPDKTIQTLSHDLPIQTDLCVVNHYWTRDEKFFSNVKIPRCTLRLKDGAAERAERE